MHPLERAAGIIAPLVALGGILLATAIDPTFSWTGYALSDLGVRPQSQAVFNGAVIAGGLVAIGYGHGLWRSSHTRGGASIAAIFVLACVCLAGVGVFVKGHPLHLPAALGFYGLVTVIFVVDGIGRFGSHRGRATLGLALVHVAVWVTWTVRWWPGDGLALPEFAGALLMALWVWFLGRHPAVRLQGHRSGHSIGRRR